MKKTKTIQPFAYNLEEADFTRRQKHPGQRGALLQNVQHHQKTTPADGVGRIPQQGPHKGK
jgi:hypothetical protein